MVDSLIARWEHLTGDEKDQLATMLLKSDDEHMHGWVARKERSDEIKDLKKARFDSNWVDYDLSKTKEDDEEYWMRGR